MSYYRGGMDDLPTDIITELYNIFRLEKDALTLSIMRLVCKTWNTIVKPFRLTEIHVKFLYSAYTSITILYLRTKYSNYYKYSWSTLVHYENSGLNLPFQ